MNEIHPVRSARPDTRTDEELARLFADAGDREAAEALIRRYSRRLRRLVISLIGPDEAAVLDAEQEVFVTMVRQIERFRGQSRFSTFFYRLARNRILDLMRQRRRYTRRVSALAEPDRAPGRLKGPERQLEDRERVRALRRAMERLHAEDRLLLYLKDGEDQGIGELAALTGHPEGTIKSRLARSRVKVANALREMGYEQ